MSLHHDVVNCTADNLSVTFVFCSCVLGPRKRRERRLVGWRSGGKRGGGKRNWKRSGGSLRQYREGDRQK